MSFEKPESSENFESKKFRIALDLQMRIMEHVCDPEQGKKCFDEWPKKIADGEENGAKFRRLFESALDKDPKMIEEWEEKKTYYTDLFVGEFLETMEEAEKRHAA